MKLIVMALALGALVIGAGAARAERWDSRGWVKLGEREVNGRVDRDRIEVGRYFRYRNLPGGGRARGQVWAK